MANPVRQFSRRLFQVGRQIPLKRKCQPQFLTRHHFSAPRLLSTSCSRRAGEPTRSRPRQGSLEEEDEDDLDDLEDPGADGYLTPGTLITAADLDPEERASYDELSKADQEEYLALQNHYAAVFESAHAEDEGGWDALVNQVDREVQKEAGFNRIERVPAGKGFWSSDEEDEIGRVDKEEPWDDSAISSVAHSELDVHREIREYTRVIAWDMPLLQRKGRPHARYCPAADMDPEYAKPFQPPTDTTPLRFRYTTYMGEVHPAAKKVVVQFCTQDLPNLTEAQRMKLIKLVGPRYNPDTDVVKMSCENFEAPAQNKRYLGDLVNKLLDEARNGADKFEDVPVDFRHHKSKRKVTFPEEWKLKPARVQELLTVRKEQKLLEMDQTPVFTGMETVKSRVPTLGGRF